MIGPHHDVGVSRDPAERQMEYAHHGDPLVPRQQRFGLYTRSLMKGLGIRFKNRWGQRPAQVPDTNQIAPLTVMKDLDTRGWLTGVTTFNFHPHLPHYALTTDDTKLIRVLARQPVDMSIIIVSVSPRTCSSTGKRGLDHMITEQEASAEGQREQAVRSRMAPLSRL